MFIHHLLQITIGVVLEDQVVIVFGLDVLDDFNDVWVIQFFQGGNLIVKLVFEEHFLLSIHQLSLEFILRYHLDSVFPQTRVIVVGSLGVLIPVVSKIHSPKGALSKLLDQKEVSNSFRLLQFVHLEII